MKFCVILFAVGATVALTPAPRPSYSRVSGTARQRGCRRPGTFGPGIELLSSPALGSPDGDDEIVRNDFEGPDPDGSYKWALQTGGGIFHEQRGSPQATESGETSQLVEGQYQYTAPDGQIIRVLYTADANGFHATGDHLPTPPPIPKAIQRALDYLASLPPNRDYD